MPTAFRDRFADEILQTAKDKLEPTKDPRGAWAAWRYELRILVDALAVTGLEHGRSLRVQHPKLAGMIPGLLIVLGIGAFIGWLDLTNTEVQVAAGALFLAGFAIGLVRPRRTLLWAAFLGFSIPVAQAISLLIGFLPPYPHDWQTVVEGFLAFIPALLGTCAGILARFCASQFLWDGQGPNKEA